MGEWVEIVVGKEAEILPGYAFDAKHFSDKSKGIPLIRIRDLKSFITELNYDGDYSKRYIVENGSVLIGMDGDFHVARWNGGTALLNQRVCKITSKQGIDNELLYYFLVGEIQKIQNQTTGTTVKHLSHLEVSKIRLSLPQEIKEQSTIATILSTIDQAIEKTEQLIAKYERIKTGLMQDLLTRGIDEQGRIRSEETHAFKDSALGRVPVEWEVGTIGKDCKIQNSCRKPLSAEVRENMKGKYPYYGPTGVLDYINEYRVDGKYVLIGEDGDHFLKFTSQEMTLLVEGKFNVNNHAHILEGKEDCTTEWIHCYFSHRDITYHLTRQGAGRFKLNKAALSNLPIAVPPITEQVRVIEMINSIRTHLTKEKAILNGFNKLKIGLMQDLLTGRVRVNKMIE
jgi:type I restriction enzyme, S subunit